MFCLSSCPVTLFRRRKQWNKIYGRFCDLPRELLEDIFGRLSVKNIIRLRSVCKMLYVIVTPPRFISMHADWCANNDNGYLFHQSGCEISRFYKGFDFKGKIEFPNALEFVLIGSCDGLLCMRNKFNKNDIKISFPCTYLWNHSIRKLKKLPETHHHEQYQDVIAYVSAFGFDRDKLMTIRCFILSTQSY